MVVKQELRKLGLHYVIVELGEVEILENITQAQKEQFKINLLKFGLELMDDRKSILIEKIKNVIIELIYYTDEPLKINFSNHLSEKLHHD